MNKEEKFQILLGESVGFIEVARLLEPALQKRIDKKSNGSSIIDHKNDGAVLGHLASLSLAYGMSLELAIKSLLILREVCFNKTHDLIALYNKLPKEDKDNISNAFKKSSKIREFNKNAKKSLTAENSKNKEMRDINKLLYKSYSSLFQFLEDVRHIFIDWRYNHESIERERTMPQGFINETYNILKIYSENEFEKMKKSP